MPYSKKKCAGEDCKNEFVDQTKDQRLSKCRTCRATRTCRTCKVTFYSEASVGFCESCLIDAKQATAQFLDPKPRGHGSARTSEQKELTRETKFGTGY